MRRAWCRGAGAESGRVPASRCTRLALAAQLLLLGLFQPALARPEETSAKPDSARGRAEGAPAAQTAAGDSVAARTEPSDSVPWRTDGEGRLLPRSGLGIYGGFPSMGGLIVVSPIDGPIGFRSGLGGIPKVGMVWTPGFELRLGQSGGTLATSGALLYANLFYARRDTEATTFHDGLEAGIGYRRRLLDRRGWRWFLYFEAGGFWNASDGLPQRPAGRILWTMARP